MKLNVIRISNTSSSESSRQKFLDIDDTAAKEKPTVAAYRLQVDTV